MIILVPLCFSLYFIILANSFTPTLICLVIFLILWLIGSKKDKELRIKEDEEAEYKAAATYKAQLAEYNKLIKENQRKLDIYNIECEENRKAFEEDKEKWNRAKKIIEELKKPLKETKETLEKIYSTDVLFPKYRYFVAVCSLYEYFASGRVDKLTGRDGAYNLYEQELRQDIIINQLDTIIEELEAIKQNQYVLYTEMEKGIKISSMIESDIDEILQTTSKINQDTHFAALAADTAATNTEAIKYLSLINAAK